MHTLLPLIAAVLACTLARPPVGNNGPEAELPERNLQQRLPISQEYFQTLIVPKYIVAHARDADSPSVQGKGLIDQELNKMIKDLDNQKTERAKKTPEFGWVPNEPPANYYMLLNTPGSTYTKAKTTKIDYEALLRFIDEEAKAAEKQQDDYDQADMTMKDEDDKKPFALTPEDNGYYEDTKPAEKSTTPAPESQPEEVMEMIYEPRETRQNPNWSKNKALVAGDLDTLRAGFTRTHEDAEGTVKPSLIHVLETPDVDPGYSVYGVALMAAVGAALAMAITGFIVGWYTLSRKAKAAAEVDYPAYGVTGPTIDSSGDRKLAQSAHMYHYQHQKQQIIAMERNGMDHRAASVSDPESEEENEEGDYTVYECPGFATTGDIEVKNPLFEEQTPSPPKSDADKPEPNE